MNTIETNVEQEFDPDSLLGPSLQEEVEIIPETFNFNLHYSTFESRPTSNRFEVKHEIEANATYFKSKTSYSSGSMFKIKFDYPSSKATELLLNHSKGLNITKFDFDDLKVILSPLKTNSFRSVSYTETDRTNRTGTVLIKF